MSCELIVYTAAALSEDTARHLEEELSRRFGVSGIMSVSYTHLTLPTILLV